MRTRFSWVAMLLASTLTGCLLPQTVGNPVADPTPAPTPTVTPEEPLDALDVTVKHLTLDDTGTLRLEVDVPEAILVLPLTEPQNYFMRLDEPMQESMPAYRTSSLQAFPVLTKRNLTSPTTRRLEAPASYAAETSFTVEGTAITATRAFSGQHCMVYVDNRDADGTETAKAQQLGEAFDSALYPKVTQALGQEPGGRSGDGFNRGESRIVLLVSRETTDRPANFDPLDLFQASEENPGSNFGKIIHLDAALDPDQLLSPLSGELGVMAMVMQRLEAFSRLKGRNLPAGRDDTYFSDPDARADHWLPVLGMQLAKLACGFSPETGDREALVAVGKYLEFPSTYRLDMPAVEGAYEDNAGQTFLLAAYLHGLKAGFAAGLGQSQSLGAEAVSAVMGRDFAEIFRDFSLATILDGLPGVPARYQIPFVALHHTYTVDGERFPFAGAGASRAGIMSGQGSLQSIMLRGTFKTKARIGMSTTADRKAALVVLRPSKTARFSEE